MKLCHLTAKVLWHTAPRRSSCSYHMVGFAAPLMLHGEMRTAGQGVVSSSHGQSYSGMDTSPGLHRAHQALHRRTLVMTWDTHDRDVMMMTEIRAVEKVTRGQHGQGGAVVVLWGTSFAGRSHIAHSW